MFTSWCFVTVDRGTVCTIKNNFLIKIRKEDLSPAHLQGLDKERHYIFLYDSVSHFYDYIKT